MNSTHALIRAWHDMDVPDGLRVELLDGELVMQANPGHVHDLPGRSLVRHTPEPFEAWAERGLMIADDYRPRADAVIIRSEDLPADDAEADWPPQIVLGVVETVSTTPTAIKRDWDDKRLRYAAAGIPVYVIVDPNDATWHVLRLDGSQYVETDKGVFGQEMALPEPLGFSVSTVGWHPYPRRTRAAGR
ncbi:Uma2 family endonuclease [Streptomyces sp. JJ36]|uniref:Uma2 family endonuclease n=1 Tax=Streptomyces sp. JJ36 TaxID=2736645 RepID=UPI001F1E1740|nr:Uma2 family endonuclease [Streptomyces sp. JJ36]MCF6522049.1 Uma2 family endonuclease [Streptomyces sp. JJ36]